MDVHASIETSRARSGRRTAGAALVVAVLAAVLGFGVAGVVDATPAAAQGCAPRLSVSRTSGLAPGGESVSVSGSCFDINKGIYVAFCVVPPPGAVPSPCGGGVDMAGAGGLSHWISSNPPDYGQGVATAYGPGGSFSVTMTPSVTLNATVDCRRVSCAIVTRNDHTRTGDRSQDVIVPVSFAAEVAPPPPAPPAVVAPPPPTEPPTTVAPETSTTMGPETTTTLDESSSTTPDGDAESAELAATTTSAEGGSSSGSSAVVVLAVAVVVLVAAGGAGWFAWRRRSTPDVP
ncbi:MAG TPA: hypothetical protein VIY72_12515 [Acidimicrobiales bacterium]